MVLLSMLKSTQSTFLRQSPLTDWDRLSFVTHSDYIPLSVRSQSVVLTFRGFFDFVDYLPQQ